MNRIAAYAPPQSTLGLKHWLIAAAVVLLVVQIVALWHVADGQVKAAESRDSRQNQQWLALDACIELGSNTARNACSADVMADGDMPETERSSRDVASNADLVVTGSRLMDSMSGGIQPASFLASQ